LFGSIAKKIKKNQKYIKNFFGLIMLGLIAWYLYQNRNAFQALKNISWQQIIWIILLEFAAFFINSLQNYTIIKRLEPRISFWDCYMLQYVNNALNKILFTVGGGAAFRALFLKRKYQFSYAQFVSTLGGIYIINFITAPLVGLVCMGLIYLQFKVFNLVILAAFLVLLISSLGIILFSPKLPDSENRIIKIIKSVVEGWIILKKDPKFIIFYVIFSVLLLFLTALQTMIGYQALGTQTNLIPMLFLSTLGIILALMNFTPDGIGIKEGIYIFTADLVRIPDNVLVLGSLILRGISIITTFIIGGISYWLLSRQLKKLQVQENELIMKNL